MQAIADAAAMLSKAQFPVILNGAGVILGDGISASKELAERWSVLASGMGRSHKVGVLDGAAEYVAIKASAEDRHPTASRAKRAMVST